MRREPTMRIPLGILGLVAALILYALGVAWASQWIGSRPESDWAMSATQGSPRSPTNQILCAVGSIRVIASVLKPPRGEMRTAS